MSIIAKLVLIFFCILSIINNSWALQVISPKTGAEVIAGSEITVIVKPDAGEEWEAVSLGYNPMTYDSISNEYRGTFIVPNTLSGNIDESLVYGKDKLGNSIWLKVNLFVKTSQNISLQSIDVDPNAVFLYKMPVNSDPNDIQIFETKNLGVGGKYSDGVERGLTYATNGTTYISSDEQVATVSPDGKVTAQGVGEARIMVKNGSYSTVVDVIVKPYGH